MSGLRSGIGLGVLALVLSTGAQAVDFTRTAGGPRSAGVGTSIAQSSSGALFAATGGGVFRSTDGGTTWVRLSAYTARLGSAPAAGGGKVYLLTKGKVYQSSDDGNTWAQFHAGIPASAGPQLLFANGSFVYVMAYDSSAGYRKIFRSAHAAAAFADKTPPEGIYGMALAGSKVLAGVRSRGVRYSTTNGDSWTNTNLTSGNLAEFAVVPGGGQVYVRDQYSGTQLFYSSDGGQTFAERISQGLPGGCNSLTSVLGADASGAVYRAVQSNAVCSEPVLNRGIFKSTDQGVHFVADNNGAFDVLRKRNVGINGFSAVGGSFFVGTGGAGLYKDDASAGWVRSDNGMKAAFVGALASRGPGKLIAGLTGGGIMTSDNNGTTWSARNTGITDRNITTLLVDGTTLLAASSGYLTGHIWRSTDDGLHWVASSTGIAASDFTGSVGLAKGPGGIYAAVDRKVFLSTDGGQTWASAQGDLPSGVGGRGIAATGSGVFIYSFGSETSTTGGVWRTTDQGAHWTRQSTGLPGPFYGRVFAVGSSLIASSGPTVYRSTNNGNSWTATTGFAVSQYGIELMSMTKDANGALYLGDEHAGLSVSTDGGATWTPDSDGLFPSGSCIQRITALAASGTKVFAGVGGAGVYSSNLAVSGQEGDAVECTGS